MAAKGITQKKGLHGIPPGAAGPEAPHTPKHSAGYASSFGQRLIRFTWPARRSGLVLVALGALCAWGWLWWNCTRRGDISFLPRMAPAEWIVYPSVPSSPAHPRLELATDFRTVFHLDSVPPQVAVRIAGFGQYRISINGTLLEKPVKTGKTWKQADLFDVSQQLRTGENRMAVRVLNSNGPPALWLSLDAGEFRLTTGEAWEASYAGAGWQQAALASNPKVASVGSPFYSAERPWTCLRARWTTLLMFAALSAAGYWFFCRSRLWQRIAGRSPAWRRELLPIAGLAGLWVALFANNLGALPSGVGFDAQGHLEYIRYIQEHNSLPLPSQGWEMFQPPLYYVLSATLLGLLCLSPLEDGGVMVLRVLGLVIGVAHFAVVWTTLRLLFPGQLSRARWGLLLAACLPALLYLSQYVTNETLAAALASGCVCLSLRALKQECISWKLCAGLGLCLGAALLAKSSALLILPVLFGALFWRWLERRPTSWTHWAGRMGLILAVCAVVCGWHYARLWVHYGNPLIGNWDPRIGFSWWQDDGYRTSAYYLRFGEVLRLPWYAGFNSFADGIYSTLWGDGLFGSAVQVAYRAPWNYDLMAIGYGLALLPTLAVLAGGILTVLKFVRQPSAEWFLMVGLGFVVALATVQMSLALPYYAMAKSFYGLSALIPFCAFGALGLDVLCGRNAKRRLLCSLLIGVWAINSYASFWISRSSIQIIRTQATDLIEARQYRQAADLLGARLESQPRLPPDIRALLVEALISAGDLDEAERQTQVAAREEPGDGAAVRLMARIHSKRRQTDKALDAAAEAVRLAPGFAPGYRQLATFLTSEKRYKEAAAVARQGLGIAPFDWQLRLAFGLALLFDAQDSEATAQFQIAFALEPGSADALDGITWELATSEDSAKRDGERAVKLAERACALTRFLKASSLSTLAAAYAEAGRYEEAVKTAEKARASAVASGAAALAARDQELIEKFTSRQPYREAGPSKH